MNLTRIGADKNWAEVYCGEASFLARKNDGSWWVCGVNEWGQLGLGRSIGAVASPQRLPFDFEAWAFAPGVGNTLMLGTDGKLWTWGYRLGGKQSALRHRFEVWIYPTTRRFPSLGFLIKEVIDYTPYPLWKLPAEVRRSLGTGPNRGTNFLATGRAANAAHE